MYIFWIKNKISTSLNVVVSLVGDVVNIIHLLSFYPSVFYASVVGVFKESTLSTQLIEVL